MHYAEESVSELEHLLEEDDNGQHVFLEKTSALD
jgi:hypothetical protein